MLLFKSQTVSHCVYIVNNKLLTELIICIC